MQSTKKDFTNEEIIKIVLSLGSEDYRSGLGGELIFQTVCHNTGGGSYKLYYYPDSGYFHCYTSCGDNFNLYELVKRSRDYSFTEARIYINNLLGISSKRTGFISDYVLTDDWNILNKYTNKKAVSNPTTNEFEFYPQGLVEYYKHLHPIEWLNEGIAPRSLEKYRIRYDLTRNRIIIPHFDIDGRLIGIRGRALNMEDSLRGRYRPVAIQGDVLNHSTSSNLYGLHKTKKAIQTIKKIMLFESEKSVLKCDTFFGRNNFTVACCGSNISNYQRDMILNLGIREVFIAFDKEHNENAPTETTKYENKILNLAAKFCPYLTTYVLWDTEGLLDYQDSPCDKGEGILRQLMKNKIEVTTDMIGD